MSLLKFKASILELSRGVAVVAIGVLCAFPFSSSALAQGKIVGHIDGITFDGANGVARGWACQQGRPESIAVQVFADGEFLVGGKADLKNEPGVNQACRVQGGKHRFQIVLPRKPFAHDRERAITVRGIRVVGNVENVALAGSGSTRFRLPTTVPGVSRPYRTSSEYPRPRGMYISSKQHPRVFMTPADITNLVVRINTPGSFSAQNFYRLAKQVKADLAVNVDWDAVYSGCDLDIYLHTFSIVQTVGYASQNRSASELSSAMNVKTGSTPVTGAAVVASELALYAALVKAGAHVAPSSPSADATAALAKRILLAWASHGFRDRGGRILQSATTFCEGNTGVSHGSEAAVGLQIGRGVAYSVHAQDLLQSIGALTPKEVSELTAFHSAMFNLIFAASNFREALPEMNGPEKDCEHYSNHVGVHLFALIALSRLLDDQRKFTAVLNGNDRSMFLAVSWTSYFDHALYGENDRPIDCHKNAGPNSLSSHPFFSTNIVAPGEILDRYRNDAPSQGFGYPLGLLAILYSTADVITNAGFDAFDYRGSRHQSLEMSTQYYACYGKHVGFKKPVTSANARECSDYQQYIGQIVNGLETDIVIGSYHFPKNTTITELENPAMAELLRDPIDSIRFGRWRN